MQESPTIPLETPSVKTEGKETLDAHQKAILERVITILEKDKELNAKVTQTFGENLLEIARNPKLSNRLFEKIWENCMQELENAQKEFEKTEKQESDKQEVILKSKEIITRYTRMQCMVLGTQCTPPKK